MPQKWRYLGFLPHLENRKLIDLVEILEFVLHDVFFNVNNFLYNIVDTVEQTLNYFAKLLKIVFEKLAL